MRFFGEAWSHGFRVSFLLSKKKKTFITAETPGYSEKANVQSPVSGVDFRKGTSRISYKLMPFFILSHCLFFWREHIIANIVSLFTLFIFVHSLALLIYANQNKRMNLTCRQWHSCEHKLIILLEKIIKRKSFQELTIKNLEKQVRAHIRCGTSMEVIFPLFFLFVYLLSLITPIKFILSPFSILSFGIAQVLLWGVVFLIIFSIVLTLATYFFGMILQCAFRTAEPTPEQLAITIWVGEDFLRKYQELSNGSLTGGEIG